MRVAIASCSVMPAEFRDDPLLVSELAKRGIEAEIRAWDDQSYDWEEPAAVIVRSTWDYTFSRDAFLDWSARIGERLHNAPAVIAWSSDKRYLAELDEAGLPVVETTFVEPGEEWKLPEGEVVVKPTVSAGARDTGRFGPDHHDEAAALVRSINVGGRTAMVQPFQRSVDSEGEAALVFIAAEFSHGLGKRAVLRPDEIAPLAEGGPRAAKAMYEPDLVAPRQASDDELELAKSVLSEVEGRFGYTPLYARVDLVRGEGGAPLLLELELVEPNLYFTQVPEAAARLASAIVARLSVSAGAAGR